MISVRDTAASALRTLLFDQPTTQAKVAFAWQIAAGAALGRAADVRWTGDGVLRATARDAAWQREIQRARPVIVERLRVLLGPDVVRRIDVQNATPSSSKE